MNTRQQLYFTYPELRYSRTLLEFNSKKKIANIWRTERDGKIVIKFEAARFQFLSDFSVDVTGKVTKHENKLNSKSNLATALCVCLRCSAVHILYCVVCIWSDKLLNIRNKFPATSVQTASCWWQSESYSALVQKLKQPVKESTINLVLEKYSTWVPAWGRRLSKGMTVERQGTTPGVRLKEVFALWRVKENDWRTAAINLRCLFERGVRL